MCTHMPVLVYVPSNLLIWPICRLADWTEHIRQPSAVWPSGKEQNTRVYLCTVLLGAEEPIVKEWPGWNVGSDFLRTCLTEDKDRFGKAWLRHTFWMAHCTALMTIDQMQIRMQTGWNRENQERHHATMLDPTCFSAREPSTVH